MKHHYHSNTATLSLPHLLSDFRKLILFTACLLLMSGSYAQDLAWAIGMGELNFDQGNAITVDASGNSYTTGAFRGTVDFDPGPGVFNLVSPFNSTDIFIQKLDVNGDLVWAKRIGGSITDAGIAITVDAAGNVYTTGSFGSIVDFDPGPGVSNLTAPSGGGSFLFCFQTGCCGGLCLGKAHRGKQQCYRCRCHWQCLYYWQIQSHERF